MVLPSVKSVDLKAPVLIRCVFIHRTNATCKWKPGDSQATNYTLHVLRMEHTPGKPFNCSTPNTSCTVDFKPKQISVSFNFCVSVTAHSRHGSVTSEPRCQCGLQEILLHPVKLNTVTAVHAKPHCLNLNWERDSKLFLFSKSQINGSLESQIEYKENGQLRASVRNVNVTGESLEACGFRPATLYSVKLRNRYKSEASLWSPWSNALRGKTGEDAPSSAPVFWRRVIYQRRYRRTSLLWKPLPHALANGRVLFYNITCQDENAVVWQDRNCSDLNISHTSCVLELPLGPCSCSITASTSVGTSPKASIWLSQANIKERPPPRLLLVKAVDDRSLELKWSHPSAAAVPLSGFIVEWFVVVTQKNDSLLHWERVNSSTTAQIISEGVEPFQRYAVSVTALYGKEETGQSETKFAYTRHGVPSAGPEVDVQTSGCSVTLSWSLPVEKRRGFIQNYTLFYKTASKTSKLVLSGTAERVSLVLSPGHYIFWMQASTGAGLGPSGPITSANLAPEEMSVVVLILAPISVISLLLIVTAGVARSKIVKRKLFQKIPDPSHSSMATWSPKTMKGMMFPKPDIRHSGPDLLSNVEAEVYESNQDKDELCSYSSTPTQGYHPFKHDTKYQTFAMISNMADASFSSCPVIYSVALLANAEPVTSSLSGQLHHSYPDVKRYGQPRGGQGGDGPFYKIQHPDMACPSSCAGSELHYVRLKTCESFAQVEPVQQNTSFSCFTDSLLREMMDLPQSSMECDPYLPV